MILRERRDSSIQQDLKHGLSRRKREQPTIVLILALNLEARIEPLELNPNLHLKNCLLGKGKR